MILFQTVHQGTGAPPWGRWRLAGIIRHWAEGPALWKSGRRRAAYRQRAGPAAVSKHASWNSAYSLAAMSLTYLRNSPKLEHTG